MPAVVLMPFEGYYFRELSYLRKKSVQIYLGLSYSNVVVAGSLLSSLAFIKIELCQTSAVDVP